MQDKLYEEILNASNEIEYELSTTKMSYMDTFIREVLRMYPILPQTVHRECVDDANVNGYQITKGNYIYSLKYHAQRVNGMGISLLACFNNIKEKRGPLLTAIYAYNTTFSLLFFFQVRLFKLMY